MTPTHPVRRLAFTLIELLVVMGIIVVAMAMIVGSLGSFDKSAAVQAAAEGLAGTLRQARMLAMTRNEPYAVVFNIQNAPGSSGRVINNRSNGHWYRILGPCKRGTGTTGGQILPVALPGSSYFVEEVFSFPDYLWTVKDSWVTPPIHLPGKRVRFLALSETEEGMRINANNQDTAADKLRGFAYARTYPRPYFGFYDSDPASPTYQRLFPWGGYDHQFGLANPWKNLDGTVSVTNYTGFFYEGKDGAISGCVNPSPGRVYNQDWNQNGVIAGSDPRRGAEAGFEVLPEGEPRALVNGDWGDSMIAFLPNGDAMAVPFGLARKNYYCGQVELPYGTYTAATRYKHQANGVSDMSRPYVFKTGLNPVPLPSNNYIGELTCFNGGGGSKYGATQIFDSEFGYFAEHLGGYHITLAPDSPDDNDVFPTAQDALRSLAPIFRVFVSQRGAVEVLRVNIHGDAWLADQIAAGRQTFPSDKKFFLGSTVAAQSVYTPGHAPNDAAYMARVFRYGWLHLDPDLLGRAFETDTSVPPLPADGPDACTPRGQPISLDLCPRMLSDQIWWLQ